MSNWKIIVPEGTTNLILNPSFETGTTHWSPGGTNTIVQSSAQSIFGAYSGIITYGNSLALVDYADNGTITLTVSETYIFSGWLYVPSNPSNWDGGNIYLTSTGFAGITETINSQWTVGDATDEWVYIETKLVLAAGDAEGALRVATSGAPTAGRTCYIDALQLENKTEVTTYCDGDQAGCEWEGESHNSHSIQSALSRAGGIAKDLKDVYCFGVAEHIGTGLTPQVLNVDEFAILPGGFSNSIKIPVRQFTLIGELVSADCGCDLHNAREALIEILDPHYVPFVDGRPQPVILRYTGADKIKEISAHYEGGLEAVIRLENRTHERIPIRFIAEDPFWYGIGDISEFLDILDSVTLTYITARLKSTGQWSDLGVSAGGTVYAIARGKDGVYVGGNFTGWAGVPNANFLARYNPTDGSWNTVGAVGDFGIAGIVRGLAAAPNGDIYIVGDFNVAAGAKADHVMRWDGTTLNAVGAPVAGAAAITSVDAIIIDNANDVIVGGNFTDFANVANADYIAKWDLSAPAWVAIGTGLNDIVRAVAVDSDNQPWAGGDFTQDGSANTVQYIGYYDGSSWVEPGGGFDALVRAIAIEKTGIVYAGGDLTQTGDAAVTGLNYIARWNGAIWSALGDGLDNSAYVIEIAPDGWVWVGGTFAAAGDLSSNTIEGYARWNGTSWAHSDLFLTANPTPRAIAFGIPDPVIENNFDVWLGFSAIRGITIPGLTTLTNDGSARARPLIVWERTGGTTPRHTLMSVRNETTGKMIILNYPILDGEKVVLDTSDGSVTSSFFGSVPRAVLPVSDFADFELLPGDNDITAYRRAGGAGTVTAYVLWRETYSSLDK